MLPHGDSYFHHNGNAAKEVIMTNEEKLIKFAEHQGWTFDTCEEYWFHPDTEMRRRLRLISGVLPDYQNDLNIIAEIEKGLSEEQWVKYMSYLFVICCPEHPERVTWGKVDWSDLFLIKQATAQQRRDALGRVFGLWEE
jgi:hypothetical protein